jgi:hypothetical protein
MKNSYLTYVLLGAYVLIMIFFGNKVFAADCTTTSNAEVVQETTEIKTDVPSHLKGATITVRLADGRETTVPAEKFKVVPRAQQFIVAKTYQLNRQVCSPEKNRLSLLGGNGPKEGLNRHKTATKVTVESDVGAVGGLQYQRLLDHGLSLGIQGQSNESVLVNIGIDF